MATTGYLYQGKCYLRDQTLKNALDGQFPIFVGNGTTFKAYALNGSSNITLAGRYTFSIKDESGTITTPAGLNVQLTTCDYDTYGFNPLNVSTYQIEDISILIVLFVAAVMGLISGVSWGKK